MRAPEQSLDLSALPAGLRPAVSTLWEHCRQGVDTSGSPRLADPALRRSIARVWACSPFIAKYCTQDPKRFLRLLHSGDLERSFGEHEYERRVRAALLEPADETALQRGLRRLRNQELVRIAWRDLCGAADVGETMRDLSRFAEAVLDGALAWLYRRQCRLLGTPSDESGEPQALVVIAMGKLGGQELNFSSDIDLIFAYPKTGDTAGGGSRGVSNQEFFSRLGQQLIKTLAEATEEGFVFRVDMRLRPFGDSGPLVASFEAMETYYATHGRDWERYAMIKARVVAGDKPRGEGLLDSLRPFVYRRYLDFGAIQSLREMKQRISAEVKRKGLATNIKLGPGGIREIEFIGQTFQLIRGGRVPRLQSRRIVEVLATLSQLGYLPGEAAHELIEAYSFLRNTEHRLQQIHDCQTHSLPTDPVDQDRVALGLGFEHWADFCAALATHRDRVQSHFDQLLARPAGTAASEAPLPGPGAWQGVSDEDYAWGWLRAAGFGDPAPVLAALRKLYQRAAVRQLSREAQERLERLMPMLLVRAARVSNPAVTVERLLGLIEAVAQRSVYLALLAEYPDAREQLLRLCSASPWIAHRLSLQPILLDELLDPRMLYTPPGPGELEAQLQQQLSHLARDDLEQELEGLRHFKHAQVLRVAAADIAGALRVAAVSDHLCWIAETVLRGALGLASEDLTRRHGVPRCLDEGTERAAGFAIIAYGKLGGHELGYGSDLDLVFLHDSRGEQQVTDGAKPLDNSVFFTRLAQRLIHFISTATSAGRAYEIDSRLRPNGSSGLLVSSLDAYRQYQQEHAWTWEQQALIRARPVAGDPSTQSAFAAVRASTLEQAREEATLKRDIREMRERMRHELGRKEPGCFDLKQGPGGITDIEFMVQYAVLRWAAACPRLLEFTDNRHLLEVLAGSGLADPGECEALRAAYFAYRARTHALALQEQPALVSDTEVADHRDRIADLWQAWLAA